MPTLILSSRFSIDSQILRTTAQSNGWGTYRLDGEQLPEWFDPADEQIALYYTAPHAFEVATQLARTLAGCCPDWTVQLPGEFLRRNMRQMTLSDALRISSEVFVKHSVSKTFEAGIYDAALLADSTREFSPTALLHVCEVVDWVVEYRCFVAERNVFAISPYRRHDRVFDHQSDLLKAPAAEIAEAKTFAESVLSSEVDCPPAFVLDVGIIKDRGWAVVECNECWASGIYACDPKRVLDVLLMSCVTKGLLPKVEEKWDFRNHYFTACSDGRF